ncbi:MAG: undecaprenyldiphospho-muramoylpentapeptide beta-N-acetylglucosaminyltransferase [Sneathiellales bacterium]|nr:undecaprenyldiphospho-muramoylpentapeptide beta-N-acetylglucosaminyltransferase [Sneathiellales bacterium]
MKSPAQHIVLASGGTGGHIFPARALAEVLINRGINVTLMTDQRGERYEDLFPGASIECVRAGSPSVGGMMGKIKAGLNIVLGSFQSIMILRRLRPDAVVGFGGYPSMPPAAAATLLGIPLVLHEQNAVLGRVNRLLAGKARRIATSFHHTESAEEEIIRKMRFTGNPVRQEILKLHGAPYALPERDGKIGLLILGGSQGATVLSDILPGAIGRLSEDLQRRLEIVQQCRPEDLERVKTAYATNKAEVTLASFFDNVPELLSRCHLAITRSGASTIAELAVSGRPAILVPYKHAMDNHQQKNAENEVAKGAARLLLQDDFTEDALATLLTELFDQPDKLSCMARASSQLGEIHAAEKLADLVVNIKDSNGRGPSRAKGKVAA